MRVFHPLQFGFVEPARVPHIEKRCDGIGQPSLDKSLSATGPVTATITTLATLAQ